MYLIGIGINMYENNIRDILQKLYNEKYINKQFTKNLTRKYMLQKNMEK